MFKVDPNSKVYWPGMILGLPGITSLLGIAMMIAAYRLPESRTRCKVFVGCCVVDIVVLVLQVGAMWAFGRSDGPNPVAAVAVTLWCALFVVVNAYMINAVRDYEKHELAR